MFLNTSPQQQGPITTPQINTPSSFNSGNLFEKMQGFQGLAAVSLVGIGAKKVFDSVTGNVGRFTGRTDLQRSINRAKKGLGVTVQVGGGFLIGAGGLGAGIVAIDLAIDTFETVKQRELDSKEALYRDLLRGNRINESRSR
jgi:hypothetical protein